MPYISKRTERIVYSIGLGILLTIVLTFIAFMGNSRAWGCTFAWNGCLGVELLGTPKNDVNEGSPLDIFGFFAGICFGVPFYAIFTFVVLEFWSWLKQRHKVVP